MALKSVLDTLDGVDAAIQPLYAKGQDNKFYLGVEGMVPSSRVDEFRTNNIALKKELEKFDGVDPEKYRLLTEAEKNARDKKMIDSGKVDELVAERVKAIKEESEGKVTEVTKTNDALNVQLASVLIDSTVKSAAVTAGVLPTAVDDVVLRAKGIFQVKSGVVTPIDAKGGLIYGKDGVTPLSIDEWVQSLKKSAGHLFEFMRGSGAHGGGGLGTIDTSKLTATQKIAVGLAAKA